MAKRKVNREQIALSARLCFAATPEIPLATSYKVSTEHVNVYTIHRARMPVRMLRINWRTFDCWHFPSIYKYINQNDRFSSKIYSLDGANATVADFIYKTRCTFPVIVCVYCILCRKFHASPTPARLVCAYEFDRKYESRSLRHVFVVRCASSVTHLLQYRSINLFNNNSTHLLLFFLLSPSASPGGAHAI